MDEKSRYFTPDTLAVTPDARFIIVGTGYTTEHPGDVRLYDFNSGELIRKYDWKYNHVSHMLVTPDSHSIVISSWNSNRDGLGGQYTDVINVETGEMRLLKFGNERGLHLTLTWDKKFARFGDYLWDWQGGGEPMRIANTENDDENRERRIDLSQDTYLASNEATFVIKSVENGNVMREFSDLHRSGRFALSHTRVSHDGRFLLAQLNKRGFWEYKVYTDVGLAMWAIQTGKMVKFFESTRSKQIKAVDVTGDNRYAVVLCTPPYHMIQVIDIETGMLRQELDVQR